MAQRRISYSSSEKVVIFGFRGGDNAALPAGPNIGINGRIKQNKLQIKHIAVAAKSH